MLRKQSFNMQYALRRAADAADRARRNPDAKEMKTWLAIESGWLRVARNCGLINDVALKRPSDPLPRRNEMVLRRSQH